MDDSSAATRTILVTGATGYVGGRLVPRLLEQGYRVRCLARDAARIEGRGWKGVEVATGDVLEYHTLLPALQGVDTAYYLVHAMAGGEEGFEMRDLYAAQNFGRAAQAAGVRRIIYLGGLGRDEDTLSPHLRSRHEVGEQLRSWEVAVTEFRAGVIIGAGSVSFDLVRYSDRTGANLDQSEMGEYVDAADRDRRCAEVPGGVPGDAGDGEADPGDRGPRYPELWADDAGVCEGARVEALAGAGASVDAEVVVVVGEAGDAIAGERGQAVDRWVEEPGDRGRRDSAAVVCLYADGVRRRGAHGLEASRNRQSRNHLVRSAFFFCDPKHIATIPS